MVTEYLGDTWYNTTTDNNHKITIRVTDKAGNSTTYYFTLQFDVLIPQLAMTSNVSNSALITGTPFTSRTSVELNR